ncbi:PREDICTED: alpha-tubulin N-acetyltransferase-like [Papilio polytes]|uniref:alpha-tubulin N-acetyltransferase-like n=1 Tax=Papilio polytes TaxID=76194 RepID=UPI00067654C4|nr:PREDICTED: alpha-tubulin N-acetyltransferase-like [Papilio polytes]
MSNTVFSSVNDLFKDNISIITVADFSLRGRYFDKDSRLKFFSLEEIINTIGQMSAKAQGLKKSLTSLEKLSISPNNKLYILKDEKGNGGAGEVLGMLKIGPKQLFLHSRKGKLSITTPMCVLDFYVVENRQRQGFGKKLFDFMLEDQKLKPYELAIDGPSLKMLQFLKKHYNFNEVLKQSNNFAVCDKFFESANTGSARPQDEVLPTPHPRSEAGAVIHGNSYSARTFSQRCTPGLQNTEPTRRPPLKEWSSEIGAVIHGGSISSSVSKKRQF